jgi:hypothetical protein
MPCRIPDVITTPFDNLFEGREKILPMINENGLTYPRKDLIDIDDNFSGGVTFIARLVHRNERSLNETMFLVQRNNLIVPNDKWLNVLLEDDTSTVYATISRFKFPSMGIRLLNDYQAGDWFGWVGIAKEGRRIYIEKYKYLGDRASAGP